MSNATSALVLFLAVAFFACDLPEFYKNEHSGNEVPEYNAEEQRVFDELEEKDSLLFRLGFNECDTTQVRMLVSEDFEFYHDQSGITDSKEMFIQSLPGLCNMAYKPTRELVEHSLAIHLLKNNGELYGAIQTGEHLFYGKEGNQPKYLTSTAKFTHLWIIEGEDWKLKRVLSYDHVIPNGGGAKVM